MKRLILAAVLLYCVTLRLGAQQQIRHEFSMGFGVGNNMADKKPIIWKVKWDVPTLSVIRI